MGEPSNNKVYSFVVGDANLDVGDGRIVGDLEEMKQQLMKIRNTGNWDLIIRMHGADDALAIPGLDLVYGSKGVYTADKIKALFGDEDFQKWRDTYGPARTSMNSCNIDKKFETVILDSLNRPGGKQRPQGLGKGCHPHTESKIFNWNGKDITHWSQYAKLNKSGKKVMEDVLKELNKKFGYFGSPPVDESLLLKYYFDEPPKGSWALVTVGTGSAKASKDTGISFYNRATDTRFVTELCTESIGLPKTRRESAVPPVRD